MDAHQQLLSRLAKPSGGKIVLLVLDGVGDLRTAAQPRTALDAARLPHCDALAARSALGRIVPVATGVTPGSGPGHLALFGYDPARPEADVGRGILEALGMGIPIRPGDVAARGNFSTADEAGRIIDRRAGRISGEECARLVGRLNAAIRELPASPRLRVEAYPGEGHRFVLLLRGEVSSALADTDPQAEGVPPKPLTATAPDGEATAGELAPILDAMAAAIAHEPRANRFLLRGFEGLPHLPQLGSLYHLRGGAFAGYPLYRGVAVACGMEIVPCGKAFADAVEAARRHWERFDFLFLHVKQTDMAGEDGDLAAKAAALEEVDAGLPALLALGPDVLAVTGDHSTPAPLRAHSWHPVPLLLHAASAFIDDTAEFTEEAAARGGLGTFPARELMGLLLAHAGRLAKYGA